MVLSQNLIRSVTLDHNQRVFEHGIVKLMIINSGNANSVTGPIGDEHVNQTVNNAAEHFGCLINEVGVASTGIIGVPLPIDALLNGLKLFSGNEKNGKDCGAAILTTDLVEKSAFRTIEIKGQTIKIAGITKGSGMISPNMATTLGFIVTDLKLDSTQCHTVLQRAIPDSYNMLSVDTDQSTNDMVSLQSSGIVDIDLDDVDLLAFENALTELCIDLAKQIAKDGEGAEHFIEVNVSGAQTKEDARRVAKLVVDSPLVKTAVAGEDPNWGRIIMALGKDPKVLINQSVLSISVNGLLLFQAGEACQLKRTEIKKAMNQHIIVIDIIIGDGIFMATSWGCDLTHGYIDINTAYN